MRLRRTRWLLALCAVTLVASNVTAAVRACSIEPAGNNHLATHPRSAETDRHVCPDGDEASQCLAHCTQSAKSTEPNLSSDVPALAVGPLPAVFVVSFHIPQGATVVATAPPVVGPPLTILFRKLRN